MSGFGWLESILSFVRCPKCHESYFREDVNVVGNHGEYWFLRLTCHVCGEQRVGAVIVKELYLALPTGLKVEGAFSGEHCANCYAVYNRDDIGYLGYREQFWYLRCACHACGRHAMAVGVVSETPPAEANGSQPPFQVGDVLTAHEILKDFHGNVDQLFAKKERKDPWKELLDEHRDDPGWNL